MPAKVDKEKCEGCGKCVDACSAQSIVIEEEKAKIDEESCVECAACVDECPEQAITME